MHYFITMSMTDDPCAEIRKEFHEYSKQQEEYRKQQEANRKIQDEIIKAQNTYVCNILVKPLISNIVGELLLYVIAEQPKAVCPSVWFFRHKNSNKQKIRQRIKATVDLFCLIPNFRKVANGLITQRNCSSHCSSVAELKNRINEALQAFDAYPALRITMGIEYSILNAFNEIEKKF